jgi:hypothetical protein
MVIDIELWAKEYEKDYNTSNTSIKYYIDNCENALEEKSPYFSSISKVIQKRGYLLKKEFISICEWKTKNKRVDINQILKK